MSKYSSIEAELDRRSGFKPKSNKEIAESIVGEGTSTSRFRKLLKNHPAELRKNLQESLDGRVGLADIKEIKRKLTDYDLLNESILKDDNLSYTTTAKCKQCGWAGSISINCGSFISGAKCPDCGCGPGVLLRESNPVIKESLQTELDARAESEDGEYKDVRESAARESVIINLSESNFENNTITLTLPETKNFTSKDLAGKKIYLNRPTASEKKSRPERDLKDWVATIIEAIISGGKVLAKAHIHDAKIQELLENPVSKKAMGLVMDSGNFCFVTEGGRGLS